MALRSAAVVDFNKADANAVVHSGEQSGVKSRRQRCGDGRLEIVYRFKACRREFCRLSRIILPIVPSFGGIEAELRSQPKTKHLPASPTERS